MPETQGKLVRELWVVESLFRPKPDGWHPLKWGIHWTKRAAEHEAYNHQVKYPNEPCRVVRYIPEEASHD